MFRATNRRLVPYNFHQRYAIATLVICFVDLLNHDLANLFLSKAIAEEEYYLTQCIEVSGSLALHILCKKRSALQAQPVLEPLQLRRQRIQERLSTQDEDERTAIQAWIAADTPKQRLFYKWIMGSIIPTAPTPTTLRRVCEGELGLVEMIHHAFTQQKLAP